MKEDGQSESLVGVAKETNYFDKCSSRWVDGLMMMEEKEGEEGGGGEEERRMRLQQWEANAE
jgi:hypothetical protein